MDSCIPLDSEEVLSAAIERSHGEAVVIFKHSTRCAISSMAYSRLKQAGVPAPCYFLDILRFRPVSSAVAEKTGVEHESPQLLLLYKGECVYEASHMEINSLELQEQLIRLN